jgi:hypothetical protein
MSNFAASRKKRFLFSLEFTGLVSQATTSGSSSSFYSSIVGSLSASFYPSPSSPGDFDLSSSSLEELLLSSSSSKLDFLYLLSLRFMLSMRSTGISKDIFLWGLELRGCTLTTL